MSSRVLIIGEIHRGLVRRKRHDDGRVFGVFTIRDSDRTETRFWKAFVNDLDLIEAIERLRAGEPIGASGPFSFRICGPQHAPEIEHRLTVNAIIDTSRPRKAKTKTAIRKEMSTTSNEADQPPDDAGGLNDDLPF